MTPCPHDYCSVILALCKYTHSTYNLTTVCITVARDTCIDYFNREALYRMYREGGSMSEVCFILAPPSGGPRAPREYDWLRPLRCH